MEPHTKINSTKYFSSNIIISWM